MANIIEQQDLLKGLPDTRLAMLLQNPVADIPPFLVAAEAQRRQAIRQQFAGSAPKESVVDTLTKQIASVPQNIQAPAQTPVNIPQTPQMQGVMALQNQPQQQPQQQMRQGGMVQRYQFGGEVAPTYKVAPMWNIPQVGDWVSDKLGGIYEWATTPYSEQGPKPPRDFEGELPDVDLEKVNIPESEKVLPFPPKRTDPGKEPTSEENKAKDQGPRTETAKIDKFRAQMEELTKAQEPSSWEKAQRWFAMAEQFYDPSKTTGQSIAGAGRAFAEMTGEQARAQRDAELAGKRALLEYDIGVRDYERQIGAASREEKLNAFKFYTEQANANVKAAVSEIDDINRRISEYTKNLPKDPMTDQPIIPPNDAVIAGYNNRIEQLYKDIEGYKGQQASALKGYGGITGAPSGVLVYTGDGLKQY